MKKILLLTIVFAISLFGQSNHTVTFSGSSGDFNIAEKYTAADNVDYYATFNETYIYLGAFRTAGTFGIFDHFTVYVDSDPNETPTSGTGSTSGVIWDGNTPTIPFTANYRIVLRKGDGLGESFYSSYSSGWATGTANQQTWTQYMTTTALEAQVPWSELGSPTNVYLRIYMSYNGGFFGATSASYFGSFAITSGVTPLAILDTPFPVELTSFAGKVVNGKVNLNWNTATEVNNYGFEVERAKAVSGNQNVQFAKVGFVEGNGNSNSPKSYSFTDAKVIAGKYIYRLKQVDTDGQFEYSQEIEVSVDNLINGYALEQNYPNPFNPSTSIKFGFQNDTRAEIKVYNVIGAEVATLFSGMADAGRIYEVTFDASGLASGTYFYKLVTSDKTDIRKMLLMK